MPRSSGRLPKATLALGGATLAVFAVQQATDARRWLGYNRELILDGQLWRVVTPTFLHISGEAFGVPGLPHLAVNMSQFVLLGPWTEHLWGSKRTAIIYLVSGTVAFGWLLVPNPDHNFAGGGSGGLYGLMGALLVRALTTRPVGRLDGIARAALIILISAHAWFNVRPFLEGTGDRYRSVAPLVHIGGFLAGIVFGVLFRTRGRTSADRT